MNHEIYKKENKAPQLSSGSSKIKRAAQKDNADPMTFQEFPIIKPHVAK